MFDSIDTYVLIANAFSFIGALFFVISAFLNTKKNILYAQSLYALFSSISCIICGSYSAAVVGMIAGVRNFLTAKNIIRTWLTVIFCILIIGCGIIFNNKGFIGIIAIIASLEYTILTAYTKNVLATRIALLLNVSLWLIHDSIMMLIPAMMIDIMVIITTIIKIIKEKRTKVATSNPPSNTEPINAQN